MKLWPFKKQPVKKRTIASVKGHYSIGVSCSEVKFNLYKDENGHRSYEEFRGCELDYIPDNANFEVRADVHAWVHQGDLPKGARKTKSCKENKEEVQS